MLARSDGPMPADGADLADSGYVQSFAKLAARLGMEGPARA
jgi:hypothetical protein